MKNKNTFLTLLNVFKKKPKTKVFIDGDNALRWALKQEGLDSFNSQIPSQMCQESVFFSAVLNAIKDYMSRFYFATGTIYIGFDPDIPESVMIVKELSSFGFRVRPVPVKKFTNGNGEKKVKNNTDMVMAVDILEESDSVNHVVIVTGDGDFIPVIDALVRKGKRVTVIGPEGQTALKLQWACHEFISLTLDDLLNHVN